MPTAETARVVPVVAAVRAALPGMPISIDTTKPAVAEAALDAGADLINDVWGVGPDDGLARLAAARARADGRDAQPRQAVYTDLMAEVVADLRAALDRAIGLGVAPDDLIVDPGFGFGKTAEHNLVLLRELGALRVARPARSCSGRAASPRSGSSWTCPPTSGSRRPSRRPRSGSPAARMSSGSTMSRPTSAPPGCPMPWSAARGTGRRAP